MKTPDFEPQLIAQARPWFDRAFGLVDKATADAAAHALRAVRGADGDPPAVLRRRPFKAAVDRLEGLRRGLIDDLVPDARAAFYDAAYGLWGPHLDAAHFYADAKPTAAGRKIARGAVIHGLTIDQELAGVFDEAIRTLGQVAVQAAKGDDGERPIVAWEERTARRLKQRAAGVISDSQIALLWGVLHALEIPAEPTQ